MPLRSVNQACSVVGTGFLSYPLLGARNLLLKPFKAGRSLALLLGSGPHQPWADRNPCAFSGPRDILVIPSQVTRHSGHEDTQRRHPSRGRVSPARVLTAAGGLQPCRANPHAFEGKLSRAVLYQGRENAGIGSLTSSLEPASSH